MCDMCLYDIRYENNNNVYLGIIDKKNNIFEL